MAMLKRNPDTGRIISYTPISDKKNEGTLDVALLDGRYIRSEFVNFVNVKFSSLPDAINAEKIVSEKISAIKDQSLIPGEYEKITGQPQPPDLSPDQIQALATKEYLKNIGNLIDDESDSTFALQSKIDELQQQLEQKDSIISDQLQSINNFDDVLASIAYERNVALNRNDRLREANIALQQNADEILFRTELEVAKQREQSIQSAEDLKNSLLGVADKNTEITNLQSQFNDVSQNVSNIQNEIGGIQGDIVRQDSLLQDVDSRSSDTANQVTDANNKADASLFRMEEANNKINDISEEDNAKDAFDKVFPI